MRAIRVLIQKEVLQRPIEAIPNFSKWSIFDFSKFPSFWVKSRSSYRSIVLSRIIFHNYARTQKFWPKPSYTRHIVYEWCTTHFRVHCYQEEFAEKLKIVCLNAVWLLHASCNDFLWEMQHFEIGNLKSYFKNLVDKVKNCYKDWRKLFKRSSALLPMKHFHSQENARKNSSIWQKQHRGA